MSEKLDPTGLPEAVAGLPHVVGVAPRATTAALVGKGEHTFGAVVLGIDPARERSVSSLASMVRAGAFLAPDDRDGALLGETLARNLGAAVGDEIVFIGQGADGSMAAGKLTVRGKQSERDSTAPSSRRTRPEGSALGVPGCRVTAEMARMPEVTHELAPGFRRGDEVGRACGDSGG